MKRPLILLTTLTFFVAGCITDHVIPDPEPNNEPTALVASPFVSGLQNPIGIVMDDRGRLFVTNAGTGADDASIVMIAPDGTKTTVFSGLPSIGGPEAVEGVSHLTYKDGRIYVLHGISGKLYMTNVNQFENGDPELTLADFAVEDIGTYVRSLGLTDPLNSNAFDIEFGPGGHLYITDAGSNAIIKREQSNGELSLFAKIPSIGGGDAVPTGIVYDGTSLFVSTLSGFPFAAGAAKIFKIDQFGNVNDYKWGYTNLTHLVLTASNKVLALQFGDFSMGFAPSTGKVVDESGHTLLDLQMHPTDIIRTGEREFYLLCFGDGTIKKLTY